MHKLLILLFASVVAVQANAADLIITCNVTAIEKDSAESTYNTRYEIDLEPHYFKAFIDRGAGFQKNGDGFPYSINEARITFVNDGTTSEYYDRKISKYFYQNSATGLEASGNCTRVGISM